MSLTIHTCLHCGESYPETEVHLDEDGNAICYDCHDEWVRNGHRWLTPREEFG